MFDIVFIFRKRFHHVASFFFFLIKKRNKKNQGRRPARTYRSVRAGITSSPHYCGGQAALIDFCTTVISTLDLYSLICCGFLYHATAFWLFLKYFSMKCWLHCIINPEFTVVQKPDQGTNPKRGCNPFRGAFFVSFLAKQKRKEKTSILLCKKIELEIMCG
jgi:hypothetical protein